MKTWYEKIYGEKPPVNTKPGQTIEPRICEDDHSKEKNEKQHKRRGFQNNKFGDAVFVRLFIKEYVEDFKAVIENNLDHNSKEAFRIITAARMELGYSKNTVSVDIFRSLVRKFKWMLSE
jgi:hypothetical protein